MQRLADQVREREQLNGRDLRGLTMEQLNDHMHERTRSDARMFAAAWDVVRTWSEMAEAGPDPKCERCEGSGTAYDPGDRSVGIQAGYERCGCF
jgi:hypothetical protein